MPSRAQTASHSPSPAAAAVLDAGRRTRCIACPCKASGAHPSTRCEICAQNDEMGAAATTTASGSRGFAAHSAHRGETANADDSIEKTGTRVLSAAHRVLSTPLRPR